MALPWSCSIGRTVLSRSTVSCFSALNIAPSRTFTSCNRLLLDTNLSPGKKLTSEAQKRSITVLGLHKAATRQEVQGLFEKAGLTIIKSQFRIDRFTFFNDTHFHAELADPNEAFQALQYYESPTLNGKPIHILPLSPDFAWKSLPDQSNRWYYDDETTLAEALLPIKQGRRVQVRLQTPGWQPRFDHKPEHVPAARVKYSHKLIAESFEKYGLEAMGTPARFDGRILPEPKFLCQLDFKTEEGAKEAISAMHKTELQGREIWVTITRLNEVRARQIGRRDASVLKELQGLGLAPEFDLES